MLAVQWDDHSEKTMGDKKVDLMVDHSTGWKDEKTAENLEIRLVPGKVVWKVVWKVVRKVVRKVELKVALKVVRKVVRKVDMMVVY